MIAGNTVRTSDQTMKLAALMRDSMPALASTLVRIGGLNKSDADTVRHQNDTNGDRLVCPPESPFDVTFAIGTRFQSVAPGAIVRFHTRTRLTERSPNAARDAVGLARGGRVNAGAGGIVPILFVNSTSAPCLTPVGNAVISLRAPPAGPNPAH